MSRLLSFGIPSIGIQGTGWLSSRLALDRPCHGQEPLNKHVGIRGRPDCSAEQRSPSRAAGQVRRSPGCATRAQYIRGHSAWIGRSRGRACESRTAVISCAPDRCFRIAEFAQCRVAFMDWNSSRRQGVCSQRTLGDLEEAFRLPDRRPPWAGNLSAPQVCDFISRGGFADQAGRQ